MRILKLIIVLGLFMGLLDVVEHNVPVIRETFTAYILFLAVKIAMIVLVVKFVFKRNLSH